MDGVASLSVYHEDFRLASLQGQDVLGPEVEALTSTSVFDHVAPSLAPLALGIARALGEENGDSAADLFVSWAETVARLCIGLRRRNTGGAFLITPAPKLAELEVGYPLPYSRLGESMVLSHLDHKYRQLMSRKEFDLETANKPISRALKAERRHADTDAEDRESELAACVKVVSSFASADGAVLLDPTLRVRGFGVKIISNRSIGDVVEGQSSTGSSRPKKADITRFGTRHTSMFRYCLGDKQALGIVVSQDGQVRLVTSAGQSLVLWNRVRLLDHDEFSLRHAKREVKSSKERARRRRGIPRALGYSKMPKTIEDLLAP